MEAINSLRMRTRQDVMETILRILEAQDATSAYVVLGSEIPGKMDITVIPSSKTGTC